MFPPKGTTSVTFGQAFVRVPVLSNTIVSAAAYASRYFPPLTAVPCSAASLIAEITEIGVESFIAQEKSTISTDTALVIFPVSSAVSANPRKL